VLVRASEDAGLTVRKRAVRLLWECCVRLPGWPQRRDALGRIVARSADPEVRLRWGCGWLLTRPLSRAHLI
jgi:cohesin loading factor subunit SCC2